MKFTNSRINQACISGKLGKQNTIRGSKDKFQKQKELLSRKHSDSISNTQEYISQKEQALLKNYNFDFAKNYIKNKIPSEDFETQTQEKKEQSNEDESFKHQYNLQSLRNYYLKKQKLEEKKQASVTQNQLEDEEKKEERFKAYNEKHGEKMIKQSLQISTKLSADGDRMMQIQRQGNSVKSVWNQEKKKDSVPNYNVKRAKEKRSQSSENNDNTSNKKKPNEQ